MFTDRGLARVAVLLAAEIENGQMVVSDSSGNQDGASIESVTVNDSQIIVKATFGEDKANFDWKETWIVVDQVVIDKDTADLGRKVQGSVWPLTVTIDLGA